MVRTPSWDRERARGRDLEQVIDLQDSSNAPGQSENKLALIETSHVARDVDHAAIDLDTLASGHLPAAASDDLVIRNLAAVWNNYAAAGLYSTLGFHPIHSAASLHRWNPERTAA